MAAVGIDLGSSLIKTGSVDSGGARLQFMAVRTPPLTGRDPIREGDAPDFVDKALTALNRLASNPRSALPLGISSQRSSFVLWDKHSGEPLGPYISWQDRRAADWCRRHPGLSDEISQRSGLVLSAHYVGPKLASLQADDADLRQRLRSGRVLWGTLESYFVWCCTAGRVHETDVTMAARTALFDPLAGEWSAELLEMFDVPREILPRVRPTACEPVTLNNGLDVTASMADQAAGALAVLRDADSILVNLGTGGFILRHCERSTSRRSGYLLAPVMSTIDGGIRYAIEGTIGGAGSATDLAGGLPLELLAQDPTPDAFCIPDTAGLGSPHWRADIGITFSEGVRRLDEDARKRVVLEGVLFRIAEILHDFSATAAPARIILSGGLGGERIVARGLAALLGRRVEMLEDREAAIIGVSRIAAGLEPYADPNTSVMEVGDTGTYLGSKYGRWREWLDSVLARDPLTPA
jgi:glycerol kinase